MILMSILNLVITLLTLVSLPTFLFIIGEYWVTKNENTKFGNWWRKYICAFNNN